MNSEDQTSRLSLAAPIDAPRASAARNWNVIRLLQNWRNQQNLRSAAVGRGYSMKLCSSPIVTAIVTVIVTVGASVSEPAAAQVLTVCANSMQSAAAQEHFAPRRLAGSVIPLSGRPDADDNSLIALWKDDNGFDILVNWGKTNQHSLRADGAEILGMTPDSELVHLMVAHSDGGLEHFLFSLDANGSGELLRSPSEGSDTSAVCVKPG